MQNKPLVSVIMNCYNSGDYLKEAIDSVMAQTYDNWEIIFWDNQSSDNSAQIAKSYNDPRIKYFYAPSFEKLYCARNFALDKACGDFIAFLDCDDKWEPAKLEKQIVTLWNSSYDLCYTNYYRMLDNMLIPCHSKEQPSGDIYHFQIANYSVGILTAMVRASKLKELNIRFDPQYNYPGDFDFFIRFLENTKGVYINECLACYREDNTNSMSNTKQESNIEEVYLLLDRLKQQSHRSVDKEVEIAKMNVAQKQRLYYLNIKDYEKAKIAANACKELNLKAYIWFLMLKVPFLMKRAIKLKEIYNNICFYFLKKR